MGKKTAQLSVADYQALILGIPEYAPNAIFTVASQTYTAAQAVTFLQSLHGSSAAVLAAKAAWKEATLADLAVDAQNGSRAREIRDTVALMFSNAPTVLAAFNLVPRKARKPLSTDARAAASAKAKATREARGTKSKKAKATITGNVAGVTITPVLVPGASAGSTTAASTTPATAAQGGVAPVVSNGTTTAAHG